MSGFADFMAQLQQQAITRAQGAAARATQARIRRGDGSIPEYSKEDRAKAIAKADGQVQPHSFHYATVPEAVDIMSRVPHEMQVLKLGEDIAAHGQHVNSVLYPAGQLTVYPRDVVSELDLGFENDAQVAEFIPPAVPNAPLPRPGQDRAPTPRPAHVNPVQRAYGHIDDAVNVFGPERTYGTLAEQHQDPYEYARLLAGQLAARRQRLLGTDQDPMTGFDPVLIGAMGGPGPML